MRVCLLYRDQDFDIEGPVVPNEPTLTPDLELSTLWGTMAQGDDFLRGVCQQVLLTPVTEVETILYRQDVLQDCLAHESVVRDLYGLAVLAIEREKKSYFGFFARYPSAILGRSLEVMTIFVEILEKLQNIAKEYGSELRSVGFTRFFAMVSDELGPDYLAEIRHHLSELKFRNGLWMSARLGKGNKGARYVLNPKATTKKPGWFQRLTTKEPSYLTYVVADRDEAGAKALSHLRDQGIDLVANALAQSVDHILGFFVRLRVELGFYIGSMNLHQRLEEMDEPLCFPLPVELSASVLSFERLYDPSLALRLGQSVSDNSMQADNKELIIITGANQGGKSTFLRSIGLAQLMMQSGMFVAAEFFRANLSTGIFTHYKREEDRAMNSGKLDEELQRVSEIIDQIKPRAVMLFNESFTATNEREGSEISRQIIWALVEKGIKVFFVTHLYDLAHGFYEEGLDHALFLRAPREHDGSRTFKLMEAAPLHTSYGDDLYREIFEGKPLP